ncbi:ATP synthase [Lithospermum erythrorhizon]|uniref:ATP synthase subunit delta', mitochondrial n=1 Tax=Lithospermum erythrorhizon TaxID=34254 RepID=A0AAV3PPA7_LITER
MMFRHVSSRLLSRSLRRSLATEVAAEGGADEAFVTAWKKTIANIEPPKTPLSYMKTRPPTPPTIPTKLTVNFVLPYASQLANKEVDMVIVPATTGQMGILPGHVATIAELKPGLMTVHEGNDIKKYFVSSGFAFVHANSIADIIAIEAVPIEQVDQAVVQKSLAEVTQKLSSASTDLEKAEAQIGVDVLSALNFAVSG